MKTDEEIEEEAINQARKIWEGQVVLPYTYCSCCDNIMKQRCVVNVVTGEATCARCWIMKHIKELQEKNKPQLDVADFSSL